MPSFARWPLSLHIFDRDVFARWGRYCAAPGVEPLRSTLEVVTDFGPAAVEEEEEAEVTPKKKGKTAKKGKKSRDIEEEEVATVSDEQGDVAGNEKLNWGIHALPLDHSPLAPYLEKGQEINIFEREGNCVICQQRLEHDKGLYAICSNGECEGVGHLDCWSRHLLHQGDGDDAQGLILPMEGQCPKCSGRVKWSAMMRELTLRVRGHKEVEKVLKRNKRAAGTTKAKTKGTAKTKVKPKAKAKVGDGI